MSHGADHKSAGDSHAAHAPEADPTSPVVTSIPIRMTAALDSHPLVGAILTSRAQGISKEPASEALVLVAHGPSKDEENRLWLDEMRVLAGQVAKALPFRSVDYITVRDDAPAPIRDAATAELRALVSRRAAAPSRVLVVPLLLSFSGIEAGIRKRLEGLEYAMADQGLAPDDRLVEWVLAVSGSQAAPAP
jgi:hypothetical protein